LFTNRSVMRHDVNCKIHCNEIIKLFGKVAASCLLISSIACEDDTKEAKENTDLKQKLLGTWEQEASSDALYNHFEITFTENSVIWSDSISVLNYPGAGDGSMQTMNGSCPVMYTFKDGIEHYNPDGDNSYSFTKFSDDNILLVFEEDFTENVYQDYLMKNFVISKKESFESLPHRLSVHSSAVRFSSDFKTVTFCEPRDISWCYTFTKK